MVGGEETNVRGMGVIEGRGRDRGKKGKMGLGVEGRVEGGKGGR